MKYLIRLFILTALFFGLFSFSMSVKAADPKLTIRDAASYSAQYVSQSIPDPITIEAGSTKTVVIKFKNTGTATWNEKGTHYISAYTVEPKYRTSVFATKTWLSKTQAAKVKGQVKPGGMGELSIEFKAPSDVGEYTEEFHLAAENASWMNKGYFFLKFKVVPAKIVPSVSEKSPAVTPSASNVDPKPPVVVVEPYDAKKILQSKKNIEVFGGEQVKLIVSFENTGEKTWKSYSLLAPTLSHLAAASKEANFGDESWESKRIVLKKNKAVAPKQIIRETFYFRAPKDKGTYSVNFVLQADGKILSDTIAQVNVDVTSNAPKHYREPKLLSDDITPVELFRLTDEPRIRVGLWKLEKPEKNRAEFISNDADYDLYDGEGGEKLYTLPKGEIATLSYKSGVYLFESEKQKFEGTKYFRLVPVENPEAVFEVMNQERTIDWHKGMNFNAYRGVLEYRLTDDGKFMYIINDLLLEDYIYGIAETSNGTDYEYIKALQTAARTYAYYITATTDKYPNGNFDVVAHTGDQLYLGYRNEALRPNVVKATNDTRGEVITYDIDDNSATPNAVVITPYFGNSDGMTRTWSKVWGGTDKPWLQPVKAIYDKRDKKKMYGHGVGMSQRDAMIKANEEDLDYKQLLQYYYTGVEIEKLYP